MTKLPAILATSAAFVALYGCGQGIAPSSARDAPALEPPHTSSRNFGDYILHFNSISTDSMHADVAREYNVSRSANRVLLTVAITKKTDAEQAVSVPATVTANAHNLVGQPKNIEIRQVEDGDAYYYISEVSIADRETLFFTIDATPAGEDDGFSLRFSRSFAAN
jgi:hypothetical protein